VGLLRETRSARCTALGLVPTQPQFFVVSRNIRFVSYNQNFYFLLVFLLAVLNAPVGPLEMK
jgi:hypothetical protein